MIYYYDLRKHNIKQSLMLIKISYYDTGISPMSAVDIQTFKYILFQFFFFMLCSLVMKVEKKYEYTKKTLFISC